MSFKKLLDKQKCVQIDEGGLEDISLSLLSCPYSDWGFAHLADWCSVVCGEEDGVSNSALIQGHVD